MDELIKIIKQSAEDLAATLAKAVEAQPNRFQHNKIAIELYQACSAMETYFEKTAGLLPMQPPKVQEKITALEQALQKITREIEDVRQQEQQLFEAESRLAAKQQEHQEVLSRIENLRKIEAHLEVLEQTDLDGVQHLQSMLNQRAREIMPSLEALGNELQSEKSQAMATLRDNACSLSESMKELEKLEAEAASQLTGKLERIQSIFSIRSNGYNRLREQFNDYAGRLEDIGRKTEELKSRYEQDLQIYKLHLAADEKIWGGLGEPVNGNQIVNRRLAEVKQQLETLDAELLAAIQAKAELLHPKQNQPA